MSRLLRAVYPAFQGRVWALLAFAALILFPGSLHQAQAQTVLVTVNGEAITSFDVEQRIRLAAIIDRRNLDRRSGLQELIDDKAKLFEAREIGYRVTEEGAEAEFARLARANKLSVREFEANLSRAGIQPDALKQKIRADLAWGTLLRDQARKGTQVNDEEVNAEVAKRNAALDKIVEYHLQPVLFIVPQGTNPGARLAAANAARGRVTDCEGSLDELRKLPEVAIRPVMIRSSLDLSKELVKLLEKTPVGRMTPPSATPQGIELVVVCEKKTREGLASVAPSDVATELAEKKMADNTKGYLESLRKKAKIVHR